MPLIEEWFYELGLKAAPFKAEAASAEQASTRLQGALGATTGSLKELVDTLLRTPAGLQAVERVLSDLEKATGRTTTSLNTADFAVNKFDQGMRRLTQTNAETAVRALRNTFGATDRVAAGMSVAGREAAELATQARALAPPLDRVAAGMSAAGSAASDRLVFGMTQAGLSARKLTDASEGSTRGLGKVQNALVGLAVQGTATAGPVGKLIEGLLLFGAGSTVVLGVAAGVSVIALAYRKVTEEARRTEEAAKKARDAIRESLAARAGPLPELFQQQEDLEKQRRALVARGEQTITDAKTGVSRERGLGTEEQAELDDIVRRQADLGNAIERAKAEQRRQQSEALQTITALTTDAQTLAQEIIRRQQLGLPVDALQQELTETRQVLAGIAALPAEAQAAARTALEERIAARKGSLERTRADLLQQAQDLLPLAADNAAVAIAHLREELLRLEAPADEVDAQLAPLVERLRALQVAEAEALGPERALERLDQLRQALVDSLGDDQSGAEAQRTLAAIARIDEARAKVNLQIVAAHRAQADATEQVADNTEDASTAAQTLRRTTAQTVGLVADIARGAIGVAQAFGAASDNAAAMLQNVITVADALPGLISELDKIGKLDELGNPVPVDATAIAGGLFGVLGGLAGLLSGFFGESADSKRDREIREQNTAAIRRLTKAFESGLTGSTVTQLRAAVTALLGNQDEIKGPLENGLERSLDRGAVKAILRDLGLSLKDLKDLAKELGITLNTSSAADFIDSLKQLRRALKEVEFRAFAESFAGELAFLQARANLLNLDNPIDQLEAIQKAAAGKFGSPVLTEALKGLDLTTAGGREEATQRLLELLDKLNTEGGLSDTDLGGLSSEELLDLINQIGDLLDQLGEDGTTSGGPRRETFGEFRGLTEVRGSALQGTLISIDTHVLEGTGVQREIRDLLASVFGGATPISAPPIPAIGGSASGTTGPGGVTINLSVSVTGAVSPAAAEAIGRDVGAASARELARQLGQDARARELVYGRTLVRG